eukprot:213239_1
MKSGQVKVYLTNSRKTSSQNRLWYAIVILVSVAIVCVLIMMQSIDIHQLNNNIVDATYLSYPPDLDKVELCFIREINQSTNRYGYSYEMERVYLLTLLELINKYKIIDVFVFTNDQRSPNLNATLCNLPFIDFKVLSDYYLIQNIKYPRNMTNSSNKLK